MPDAAEEEVTFSLPVIEAENNNSWPQVYVMTRQ